MKKIAAILYAFLFLVSQSAHAEFAVNDMAGFNVGGRGPVPAFSFRNVYSDNGSATTYNFASSDTGTEDVLRVNVVAVVTSSAVAVAASGVVVNGVTATQAITSGASTAGRVVELWYAANPTGTTGTISVTFASGVVNARIYVWAGYPASATPVDAVGANAASSPQTLTDLAKTSGGFAVFATNRNQASVTVALTSAGAETITEHDDSTLDALVSTGSMSFAVTATTTTDDYTATWSNSGNSGVAGATWGP